MEYPYYDTHCGEERLPILGPSTSSPYTPRGSVQRGYSNPRGSSFSSASPLLGGGVFCERHPGQLRRPSQVIPPYYQSLAMASHSPQPSTSTRPPPSQMAVEGEEDGFDCSPCCENKNVRRTFRSLVIGQILSFCLVGTGISSTFLSRASINTPTTQAFTNYFLLCFVYGTALSCKAGDEGLIQVMRTRGWKYFFLALVDVEANFMIVMAYQYTSLTSVQLLDCSTIPLVLLFSWLFLSVRYLISHVVGVCLCLVGIACVIWADILDGKGAVGGQNRVLGDFLVLGGAFLYAVANVSEEFLVKQHSRMEYLGMVGLFGTLISGIQLALLEHQQLASISWNAGVVGAYALFAISMFIFYSLVTVLLQRTSALMFNLVTLSADFYSLIFAIILFQDTFHWLYFVSFALVLVGCLIYSLRDTAQRDADEPRRVCPCLFLCCCCSDFFFDSDGASSHGSMQITPMPPANGELPMEALNGNSYGGTLAVPSNDPRFCPVHGRKTIRSGSHRSSPYTVPQRNGGFFPS